MVAKIQNWLQKYGVSYTVKKVIGKGVTRFLSGPLKVNRRLTAKERKRQENEKFTPQYTISVVVPLFNTPEVYLKQMIDSVQDQTYADWQLCLADGSDAEHGEVENICRKYAQEDSRICYKKLEDNRGISENTNACLEMVEGEYIALFDHDDLLHPSALYEVMRCIAASGADVVYTDEATFLGKETRLLSIHRKPDFYMENLCVDNYICHLTVFKKTLLEITGGFRKEYDGSQDHDMIFRLCEVAEKVCHIPKVLYFWRAHDNSVALHMDAKAYVADAGLRAVRSHLERVGQKAVVEVLPAEMLMYQVTYEHPWDVEKDITILYEENAAKEISKVTTPFILLLRSGMKTPEKDDLQLLLMHMAKKEVMAAAPMIVDERGKIIAAGVKWDEKKKDYVPKYKGHSASEPGEMNELLAAAGTPAIVTGCMLVRTQQADENSLKKIRKGQSEGLLINEPRARVRFSSCK